VALGHNEDELVDRERQQLQVAGGGEIGNNACVPLAVSNCAYDLVALPLLDIKIDIRIVD